MLAEALRDWLPNVLQLVQPYMSAIDMQMGARWNVDLTQELQTAKLGIICVTSENQHAPWMIFESGALSKTVDPQCVIPYLLNMRLSELQGPLVQFQAAMTERDDTFRVVSSVNRALGTLALSDDGLERSFSKWWPDLESTIAKIPPIKRGPPPRSEREMLEEVLTLVRSSIREQVESNTSAEAVARQRQEDLMLMAHQIQGPLLSIYMALSVATKREISATALPLIENAQGLVQDLMTYAYGLFSAFAIEAGQNVVMRPVELKVQTEVQKVTEIIQRTNSRSDLQFRFIEAGDFPTLFLDEQAFRSVLYSLIHNAITFADRHSEVIFEYKLAGPDRMPVLTVISIGEPIPLVERDRIFEKFARGDFALMGRGKMGLGLGLWVARTLMRQLGGDVTLELSVQNPKLAQFVVYFGSGSTL